MKRKIAALYDPYLDTLGGGEKHILSILKVLDENEYEISIFWDNNLQKQIEERFALQYVNKLKFLPNIFDHSHSIAQKILTLKNFDLFFYISDGSYFFSSAKKNYIFSMVPDKNLYPQSLIHKLKTFNSRFISNSHFTKKWLGSWGITSQVIYPYVDNALIKGGDRILKKDKIILTVGRFFKQLHSKQQSKLIELFNKLKQNRHLFKNFRLIIAGGLKDEDKSYFTELQELTANNKDIILKTNLSFNELAELYRKSLLYIHMTGFGVDENKYPELVEHLGITPLEAMASECLTFCYNAGGPKELIKDSENGFLFGSEEELMNKMKRVLENNELQDNIRRKAKEFIKNNFSYEIFRKRVTEVIV